jgi:hypothetical protein
MKPLVNVPLKYGVIAGILGTALVIGLFYLGRHPFLIPVYLDFRIFLFGVFIFFVLKELRDHFYSGIMYFWEGLIASFIFTATFAVIAATGIWLFGMIIPDFVQEYIRLSIIQIKLIPADVIERLGKDVYDRNLEMLPATNSVDLALLYLMQCFFIGMFISIILSVILRRQPKP